MSGIPLAERAINRLGPGQYAIEGNGVDHSGTPNVWHVDLTESPAPVCDCPAFFSSTDDPPVCKHIAYLQGVERAQGAAEKQAWNVAMYDRIFGQQDNW